MKTAAKNAIKRSLILLVVIVVLPFLAFGALLMFIPISRPNESVRNYLLKKIPIGTNWDNAVEIMDQNGWLINEVNLECGLRINDGAGYAEFASNEEMRNGSENDNIRIVGLKSIFVELGKFYGPFETFVFAYLAFDENSELVEVSIRRDIDAF